MRELIIVLALMLVAPLSQAHELDEGLPAATDLAKALPKVMILRISLSDPSDLAVAHVGFVLDTASVPNSVTFQKVEEMTAINELDLTSSTDSWRFRVVRVRPRYHAGGRIRYYYGNHGAHPIGCGYDPRPTYPASNAAEGVMPAWAQPVYLYGGHRFTYAPYHGYSDSHYCYVYSRWR